MALLINKAQKWGFIHIPKTGGTSITKLLKDHDDTEIITGHDSIRRFENLKNFFIFTMVRNPFTRIQSAYHHGIRINQFNYTFAEFLKKSNQLDLWLLPQTYFTNSGKTEKNKISYIGKYENYENDVKTIFKLIDIKIKKIPHENRNPLYDKHPNLNQEKYYKHLYTEEWMKDLVRERYKDDFKQFNYDLEI